MKNLVTLLYNNYVYNESNSELNDLRVRNQLQHVRYNLRKQDPPICYFTSRTRALTRQYEMFLSVKEEYDSHFKKILKNDTEIEHFVRWEMFGILDEIMALECALLQSGFTKEELGSIDWLHDPRYNLEVVGGKLVYKRKTMYE